MFPGSCAEIPSRKPLGHRNRKHSQAKFCPTTTAQGSASISPASTCHHDHPRQEARAAHRPTKSLASIRRLWRNHSGLQANDESHLRAEPGEKLAAQLRRGNSAPGLAPDRELNSPGRCSSSPPEKPVSWNWAASATPRATSCTKTKSTGLFAITEDRDGSTRGEPVSKNRNHSGIRRRWVLTRPVDIEKAQGRRAHYQNNARARRGGAQLPAWQHRMG